ncbi:MAG TPA: YkvA family protein [Nitriliruptorales bacterium]|nr:YkvA family protein [Nitriliruptorales bacterium]
MTAVPASGGVGDPSPPADRLMHRHPPSRWRELARFLPDVARLFRDVVRDERVPMRAKLVAGGVLAYLVSPVDLVPDVLPVAGQADDVALVLWAVRRLLRSAGYEVLKDLWRGSDDGFLLLLLVAGIDR